MSHDPSGRSLAEQAHAAGAVADAETKQTFDVTVHVIVVGSRVSAEGIGAMLELEASTRDSVTATVLSVQERIA